VYRPTIVTGAGGGAGWPALAWAVEEAASSEGRLEICHVCPPDSPLARRTAPVPVGLLELADPPLARAVAAARARLGGDRVILTVHTGHADAALVSASARADLVVVAAGGRTTRRVATRARCPVIVVRPDSSPWRGPFAGHVVVGVDGSAAGRGALAFGFAFAAAHGRPLAAVHVAPQAVDDFWVDDQLLQTYLPAEPAVLTMLATEVEPLAREYRTVAVKRAVYTGRPLAGLLRAAAGASLLSVGHRGGGAITRAVLGSVTRGVIDLATGPVAVTHIHDAPPARPGRPAGQAGSGRTTLWLVVQRP
jgi:nucleotide-binding universal stress UspA family protein